jgi:uncharacterized repeat protein (TIGR02543 family)
MNIKARREKMKTKKRGALAALAAVLLLSAVLITSCIDPINPGGLFVPKDKDQPAFVPPPGMGYVMLSFGDDSGRTIRPPTSSFTGASSFSFFDVYFNDKVYDDQDSEDTDHSKAFTNITAANIGDPLTLFPRTYEVIVWAYISGGTSGTTTTAVAYGANLTQVITGTGDTVAIVLHEITSGGNGTFTLNLSKPSTNAATTTSMVITPLATGTPGTPVTLTDALLNTYTTSLTAGYYRVEITLSRDYGSTGIAMSTTIREILHIYQGMTSTYTRTLPPVNTDRYTITYTLNNGTTATEDEHVKHGTAIAGPATAGAVPTRTGYTFDGWFTTAGSTGGTRRITITEAGLNPSPGTAYMPLANETVYARWTSTGATMTITVAMDDNDSPQLEITTTGSTPGFSLTKESDGKYTATAIDRNTPPTLVISVSNATDYDANSFVWIFNTAPALFASENGDSITTNFNNILLQQIGDHELTVEATIGAAHYLTTITFEVRNN